MEKVNPLLDEEEEEERCIFHFEVRTDLARGCRGCSKLLSKRCCEIACFPLPDFKSLETFVLNVCSSQQLFYPLHRLINLFSVALFVTNKRNSLSTLKKKRERERIFRDIFTEPVTIIQSHHGKKIATQEWRIWRERERSTIKKTCKDARGGRSPCPPAYRGRWFSSGRGKYTQTAFFISRLLPRRSRECGLKRPSWPLAMKWQCCTLRGQENPSIHATAPFFSPLAGPPPVRGHRPPPDTPPLCNANVSQ